MRISYVSIFEVNGLEQRAAEPLNDRPRNLISQPLRVDHRATVESFDHPDDLHQFVINRDFSVGRHVTAFFDSARNSEAPGWRTLLLTPSKLVSSRLNDRAQAVVRNVFQA